MIRIVVEESITKQLRTAGEPCAVFDTDGNRLGFFTPDGFWNLECPFSDEELRAAAMEEGGRPLMEILADLESQK